MIASAKLKKILLILLLFFNAFFCLIQVGQAAEKNNCPETFNSQKYNFIFNVPLPGFPKGNQFNLDCYSLGDYIKYLYTFLIGVCGLLSLFMIAVGAVMWLFAGGNSGQIGTAKKYITGAITGLLLALASYSILYIINPQLIEIKPIVLPIVKKAMLNICPDSGQKKTTEKEKYICVSNKDKGAKVDANKTACAHEYRLESQGEGGQSCWGISCETDDKVCTPFSPFDESDIDKTINNGLSNMGSMGKYDCIDFTKAKIALIKACNKITDTYTNNNNNNLENKAQGETQAACNLIQDLTRVFPQGKFKSYERCVWIDYSGSIVNVTGYFTNQDACYWCPDVVYEELKKVATNNKASFCDLYNKRNMGDQINSLCDTGQCESQFKAQYEDTGIITNTYGYQFSVDACMMFLGPEVCSK
jgi:hypothetical protein